MADKMKTHIGNVIERVYLNGKDDEHEGSSNLATIVPKYRDMILEPIQVQSKQSEQALNEAMDLLSSIGAGFADPEIWINNPKAVKRINNGLKKIDDWLNSNRR